MLAKEQSQFLKHESCPKCGSKDNLARYTDYAYCFSSDCGYYEKNGEAVKLVKNNIPNYAFVSEFIKGLRKLPVGRAWEALREDEIACKSLGVNPTNTKLTAFAIGAMFGGFAGAFFATKQTFVSPESFTFIESAIIVAIVVLGGMGSQLSLIHI